MNENKKIILRRLLWTLWATRAGVDVVDLQLSADERTVTIVFRNPNDDDDSFTKLVNVECDSGIAMIRDVCKKLM